MAQKVKNLLAVLETWVWSLRWEDHLEKGKATHSIILAWRIPWTEEPGGLQSRGSQRVRHDGDWATCTAFKISLRGGTSDKEFASHCRRCKRHGFSSWVGKILWRRKWRPTPVFLPGESKGQSSLAGYSPCSQKESDTTDHTHTSYYTYFQKNNNFLAGHLLLLKWDSWYLSAENRKETLAGRDWSFSACKVVCLLVCVG